MTQRTSWALLACLALPCISAAQTTLTYEEALARARTRAPRTLIAADRIHEVRGRIRGASLLLQNNPEIDFAAGRRNGAVGTTDYEAGIQQTFELGGRRRARVASARADLDRETAVSQNTVRELLRDVGVAFWKTIAARDRVSLAKSANDIASDLLRSMERRLEAGDVRVLDVNAARVAAARTRAELRSAEANHLAASGDLRVLLGMTPDEPLELAGVLGTDRAYALQDLVAAATDRPEVRAITAEIREAEAQARLGRGFAWPDLGVGLRYEKDEGDNIVKGGVSLTLPLFSRGQEQQAVGAARAQRLRRELEATKLAIANEVRTAAEVYERRRIASLELGQTAIRNLDENEVLARRSFEEGELNLIELLLIRRDNLETRLLYVTQLLDTAVAAVELEARAGLLK
jgi:cobalt-zinc-cadmium efflux system outer membrane protein